MKNDILNAIFAQAWEYADHNSKNGDGKHGHLYQSKLAELIINECAHVCYAHARDLFDLELPNYSYVAQCGDLIMERFKKRVSYV